MDDLNVAITILEEAVKSTPREHLALAPRLASLGNALLLRFEKTESGVMDDLNKAIARKQEALDCTANDYPIRPVHLFTLGNALLVRFERTLNPYDEALAIELMEEAALHISPVTASIRISAACRAAERVQHNDIVRASRLLKIAVELLPFVTPRAMNRRDRQAELSGFSGVASNAAALSLQCGGTEVESLQLLELGRGILAGSFIETRADIMLLESEHPSLATQFKQVRDELDSSSQGHVNPPILHANGIYIPSQIGTYHDAAKKFESTVETIRALDGFESFLRGPTEDELMKLAVHGPIVAFNVTSIRSDAFLVTTRSIKCVSLPLLLYPELEKKTKSFLEALGRLKLANYRETNMELLKILEWLWDVAVEPVLNELGFSETPREGTIWPHVWWVASGWLNLLPIHAAGYYKANISNNALDRVISSYTPTIRSLAYAREKSVKSPMVETVEALLVCMKQTSNAPSLEHVVEEVTTVCTALPNSIPSKA